jgi:thiol:disulfide interchange protein DsbD
MLRKICAGFFIMVIANATCAQLQLSGINIFQQKVKDPVELLLTRDSLPTNNAIALTLTFTMAPHIHLYAAESLFFKFTVEDKEGLEKGTVTLPEPEPFTNFDNSTVDVYKHGHQIHLHSPLLSKTWSLHGSVHFQACDTAMCFTPRRFLFSADSDGKLLVEPDTSGKIAPPGAPAGTTDLYDQLDNFSVAGSRGGYLNAATFADFLSDPAGSGVKKSGGFEDKGFLVIVLLILLGGIALNLTPCVLPMIPITIAVIGAGSQAKSRSRGMLVGGVYGLAMALTYGILGLFVVLTGTRFGVINSSPVFNVLIAVVFILMALAMFDIIQVDFTRFRKGNAGQSERGKLLTAFFMGIVASLLAGACVAPVVISVVLYAGTLYAKGTIAGLFLPFLLGAGMALPWPFAGAGLSFMPKPGKWMVWIKYVFGIFILVMALYYGYTGIHLYRQSRVPASAIDESAASNLPWLHSLEEGLQKAAEENKPVLVDFWATWCKNCTAMDVTTFRAPEVEKILEGYILVKYQAEQPDEPDTRALLNRFGVVGLPTYVVLQAK